MTIERVMPLFEKNWLHQYLGCVSAQHDLSMTLSWLIDKRPTGLGRMPMLDQRINAAWREFLQANGFADAICATVGKS